MRDKRITEMKMTRDEFAERAGYTNMDELTDTLNRMRSEDIMDVDPGRVAEIRDIAIDQSLPVEERVISFLKQTANPYCFRYNGIIVKTSFAGKQTIEDCLDACFFGN